jgi:hypothetical protein
VTIGDDVKEALRSRTVRSFAALVLAVWAAALGLIDGAMLADAATWAGLVLPPKLAASGVTIQHAILASVAWVWVVYDRAATAKATAASNAAADAADRAARLVAASALGKA